MGKDDPQRKAGWVRDPKAMSDYNQLPAVGQSDRWSERPTIKQKCSDKDSAGAEQLGSKRTNLPGINLLVRRHFIPSIVFAFAWLPGQCRKQRVGS